MKSEKALNLNSRQIIFITMGILIGFSVLFATVYDSQKGKNWDKYTRLNSGLVQDAGYTIAFDSKDRLWFGSVMYGISVFDGESWTTYTTENSGLADNSVTAIAFDSTGRAWIGTDNAGLSIFDGEAWINYSTANSRLVGDNITSIAIASTDRVWVGTRYYGITTIVGSYWKSYTIENSGLLSNSISAIAIDSLDRVWIGTGGDKTMVYGLEKTHWDGVNVYDGNSWRSFTPNNSGLPDDRVNTIAIDSNNRVWVGTDFGGVSVYDAQNWRTYSTKNSGLIDDNIISIAIDSSDQVWFGSETDGVSVLDGTNWVTYTPQDSGLLHENVRQIITNNEGDVWLVTREGINRAPTGEKLQINPIFTSLHTKFFSPKFSLWRSLLVIFFFGNLAIFINDFRTKNALGKQVSTSSIDQVEGETIPKVRPKNGAAPGALGGLTSSVMILIYMFINSAIIYKRFSGLEGLFIGPMIYGFVIFAVPICLIIIGPLAGMLSVLITKSKSFAFFSGFVTPLLLEVPILWIFLQ